MNHLQNSYHLILEIDKLKEVFRNTITVADRKESTAEHSWSAAMILLILMNQLKEELGPFDEFKVIKLILIHDVVEVYAGDVIAFDTEARKNKEKVEQEALTKLMAVYPQFGEELHSLWHEFEAKTSLEAKIAKAADAICPIFQRLHAKHSYVPFNVNVTKLEMTKSSIFSFSKTFTALFSQLKRDLLQNALIAQ